MYKYVQRRLKDFVERTYSILDVKKSWTSIDTQQRCTELVRVRYSCLDAAEPSNNNGRSNPSASSGYEKCHQHRKFNHQQTYFCPIISALTWSSALVCGWYLTQLLCLNRRGVGWDSRCIANKVLLQSTRAFHTRVARVALAAPFPVHGRTDTSMSCTPNYQKVEEELSYDSGVGSPSAKRFLNDHHLWESREELYDLHKFVINVNHEEETFAAPHKASPESPEVSPTIESAVNDLVSVLGDIEFELGVKSLSVGDFNTAVSHFKLATSHHHAAATFNLGICFEEGLGVTQNMRLAMECYQAASDLGHPKAMYNLGVFYASGLGGLSKNRRAAKRCFAAAAQLGVSEAKTALGMGANNDEMPSSFGAMPATKLHPVLVS